MLDLACDLAFGIWRANCYPNVRKMEKVQIIYFLAKSHILPFMDLVKVVVIRISYGKCSCMYLYLNLLVSIRLRTKVEAGRTSSSVFEQALIDAAARRRRRACGKDRLGRKVRILIIFWKYARSSQQNRRIRWCKLNVQLQVGIHSWAYI